LAVIAPARDWMRTMTTTRARNSLAVGCALGLVALALRSWLAAAEPEQPKPPSPDAVRFFETKVRPVLADNCFGCHGETKQRAGLRLDSRKAILTGGDRGPAVVPGQPEKSLLIKAVNQDEDLKMPPKGRKLSAQQIADLTQWVKLGAPWPAADTKPETAVAHWAFQPLRRPAVPAVKDQGWARNPIDAFILAKLEAQGLRPSPPAARTELIRRVSYDLTGLPPTPAEVDTFLADDSPAACEALVDRLLESPHYGEKWGRHWLDLVRFAETNSYERDNPKPDAWRYRDYVIRSFNQDKPFDRFLREQLAGDELYPDDPDAIIATGYYRLGIWDDEPVDRVQAHYDGLDDVVATTGQVFLGLTMDCARCHNHKREPILQKDYYRFLAFFQNINDFRNGGPTDQRPIAYDAGGKAAYEQKRRDLEQKRRQAQAALAALEKTLDTLRAAGETPDKEPLERHRKLLRELAALNRQTVPAQTALCVTENGTRAPDTFVLYRGNPAAPREKVEPGFPQLFGVADPVITPPPGGKSSGRRRALADWLASGDNPLTARVLVNRLWQHHFGRGIVRSPNDFGTKGDAPTHPELLDWLAAELQQNGWRLKALHRLILTSSAYRMSSRGRPEALAKDPTNNLFWRFDMRRLGAEEIRDSILALGGTLNAKMYGPGTYPEIPPEVLAGQSRPGYGWGKSPPEEQARRSVYIHVKRSLLPPILADFDAPETDRTSPVRFATTQPTQALVLLNGAFVNKQAGILAERVRREAGTDPARQVRLALRLATARQPGEGEVRRGLDLIAELKAKEGVTADAALKYFCLVVLNLNEFIYLD
jgi:mono/diheme cytochrome c family protein